MVHSVSAFASASAASYVSASTSAGLSPRLWRMSDAMPAGLPPSWMSVPRPAMLVAIVTVPDRPAWATTSDSRSCCFALSVSCLMPRRLSSVDRTSLFSTDTVPTSTGRPAVVISSISSMRALNLLVSFL